MYCFCDQIFDINNLKEKTFVLDPDLRAFSPWAVDSGLGGVRVGAEYDDSRNVKNFPW